MRKNTAKKVSARTTPARRAPVREEGLNKKKLMEFKKLLESRVEELIDEAKKSVGDLAEQQENYADMTDQASAELERNFLLKIKDRERKLILKYKEALSQIATGTYGTCEICGDSIGEERLKARPVTTQCIECKTDMEEQERRAEA